MSSEKQPNILSDLAFIVEGRRYEVYSQIQRRLAISDENILLELSKRKPKTISKSEVDTTLDELVERELVARHDAEPGLSTSFSPTARGVRLFKAISSIPR